MKENEKKYYMTKLKCECMPSEYEIGKTYHIDGKLEIEKNKYIFYDNIIVYADLEIEDLCIFEVVPSGTILNIHDEDGIIMYYSEGITIVRELSEDDVLDVLVNDKRRIVRAEVASYGRDRHFDVLVYDNDMYVRKAVAKYGRDKDLDILVHDEDCDVRMEVLKRGRDKDLDILVHDKEWHIRMEVAKRGRGKDLDILINDITLPVSHVAKNIMNAKNKSKREE